MSNALEVAKTQLLDNSGLDMNEEDATKRVVAAVENPYTTILGHPTGRLLLARKGFPLNYDKVFDACVANNVAIEIGGGWLEPWFDRWHERPGGLHGQAHPKI